MLLVQDGRLKVDDPVSRYLEGTPPAWQPITIRHLLTHTGGHRPGVAGIRSLQRSRATPRWSGQPMPNRFASRRDRSGSTATSATSRWRRSSRKVSGQPWTRLPARAGLQAVGHDGDRRRRTRQRRAPNRAPSATAGEDNVAKPPTTGSALRPSGAFLSTVARSREVGRACSTPTSVLSEAQSHVEMWTPVKLDDGTTHPYGFGWEIGALKTASVWCSMAGSMPGFRSGFARFIDDQVDGHRADERGGRGCATRSSTASPLST